ncbi:MAG: alpha/beta hydrolase [Proteobacteria bacterium]|nr:alpha/beta hydrolase [Pseudomonadota bacterium]
MDFLENGITSDLPTLILAHGAGAPMDSPFMQDFAEIGAEAGLHVLRFEFPYMQLRRQEGSRRPPDRQPKLLNSWRDAINQAGGPANLVIGGKSMGGRMASMIADEMGVKGLVCLGYPFYAPGKADRPRIDHLKGLSTPTLILQGERDAMGNRETVPGYDLSSKITFSWLEDGDHSFKPRKKSGRTEAENWRQAVDEMAGFVRNLA